MKKENKLALGVLLTSLAYRNIKNNVDNAIHYPTRKVVGDKIVLGAAISLTGKYSRNGYNTQNGYNMAVDRINSMGGVQVGGKSYKFEIIYYDDESNPRRAAKLAERLISQDGVEFMLGPYSSTITKAIAQITEKNGVPMVSANGASRSLFTNGYKNHFSVLSPANKYLTVAIETAVKLNGGKGVRIAQAFEQDSFSQDVRLGILEAAKETGSKIIIDDILNNAATLFKVKALKPDILVVSGHTKGALTAIRQIAEMKVDVPMLAMTHCDASKLSKQHGKNSEYTLCASQWHKSLTYKDDFFKDGMTYDAHFTKEFGYAPPYQSAESSAALLVFKDAFERANSFDQKKVRDALADTNMQTFYGNIKFGSGGQNIAKSMVLFQVRCNGTKCENKVVAPLQWANDKLIHPIPKWSDRDREKKDIRVTEIIDGDTIRGTYQGEEIIIRLAEINSPEMNQPYGVAAKERLKGLIEQKDEIKFIYEKVDIYGRYRGWLYHNDKNINYELIRLGCAWVYVGYVNPENIESLNKLQDYAKSNKLGLWNADSPIPPWESRKNNH